MNPSNRGRAQRPLRLALLAAAATLVAAPLHAGASPRAGHGPHVPPSSFTKHTYPTAGAPGARDYWLFVPSGRQIGPRPLVVFLHGCLETAEQTAASTRFNELAERRGFVVAYPDQLVSAPSSAPLTDGNGVGCWNWFLPEDQVRASGEAATVAGITREVMEAQHIDARRVYVEGISAGADLAVTLGATYPDVYAAVGVLAGCAYQTCSDSTGALAYAAMGPRARVVPMFVENGSADTANSPALAEGLVASWLGVDDFADNGALDDSVPRTPASTQSFEADQTPQPGSGNACVHNGSWTCPGGVVGFQGSYPYTVRRYADAHGCDVLDYWLLHGMEHAHPFAPLVGPDGQPLPYTDPPGPDVTTASYNFFLAHPMNGRCTK